MKNGNSFMKNYFNYAISALFMACLTATAFIFNTTAGIISAVLFSAYVAFVVIYIILEKRSSLSEDTRKTISGHIFDYLQKNTNPIMLISGDDRLLWYNKSYADVYEGTTVPFNTLCEQVDNGFITSEKIGSDNFSNITKNGKHYEIKHYEIDAGSNKFLLVEWKDVTELRKATIELNASNSIVSYIVVDNINEASQGMQDKYREVSAHISATLGEWASSLNGVIKEYERDRYIAVFEERYLEQQKANKFDILDKISDLTPIDAGGIPMTVSMGIAHLKGTLAEKEAAANSALQLALQRGGAQVVVKSEENNEIFGGKTKTVQKITKIKARSISTKLVSEIKASSNILVMAHQNPDFDAIASSVGIARLCMYHGKPVNIITDLKNASFEACMERLKTVKEYENIFIDSVYGQDLLTPDTLLVIVDASNPDIFESAEVYSNSVRVAIIDHHRQAAEFPKEPIISYVEPTSSSASELVSEILEYSLPPMTLYKEESELLMTGIFLDTQTFSRNVGIRTFGAAVYLRSEGGNPGKAQTMFKTALSEYKKMARYQQETITYKGIFAVSTYELDNEEENRVIAARAADRMLQIEGIRASFALATVGDSIHISARSDSTVNVGLILEKLGGGGHFDSAGARIGDGDMESVLRRLRDAITAYCDSLK